jgi:hypothetical protein
MDVNVVEVSEEIYSPREEVKAVVKAVEKTLTTEEKLAVRSIEAEYLRIQVDLQNFAKRADEVNNRYKAVVEQIAQKYAVDLTKHAWDNLKLEFKKL